MSDVEQKKGNIPEPFPTPWALVFWIMAATVALCLAAVNLIFGNLNQDEGWYLYAARLIASGQMPYRDFAFTQGPALPYAYALFHPLIEWGGLMAGRIITATLGIAGAVFAAVLAGKLARSGQKLPAVLVCFMLISINVYQSYFCTVVKTYSLAILFLVIAFLLLHHALARTGRIATMLSAALFVLAAATRVSAAIVLPIVFILLLWECRKFTFRAWLYFVLGGMIASALVLGPFLINCPFNFYYFAGRYHSLRNEGGVIASLMFKGGFVSRVFQAYFVCFAVWLVALVMKCRGRACARPSFPPTDPEEWSPACRCPASVLLKRALWFCAIGISVVHFFAPFPYDDYQVFVYPLFAVVISVMILDVLPEHAAKYLLPVIFCLCLISSGSSPINQDWFIEGRELIWWRSKDKPALIKLQETAHAIRALCKPNDLLLTQDPYLAVESETKLPHGLELGQFSYFPDLTRKQAEKMNVLNRDMFAELLQTCRAPAAAFSGYGFAMQAPGIIPVTPEDKALFSEILNARYEFLEIVPHFGQASTELKLYRKK